MTRTGTAPVVVGVDASPDSQLALRWAVDDAQRRTRPLQLICAWQSDYGADTMAPMVSSIEDGCRAVLGDAARQASALAPGLQVLTTMAHLQAASALIATSRQADSVVVGSRGVGAVQEAFAGSTSMQVAAYASCPVVVVRRIGTRHDASRRVVVGVDGSDLSAEATGYAFEKAADRHLGLTVLHAWDATFYTGSVALSILAEPWNALEREQEDITAQAISSWNRKFPDVDVRTHVVQGRPADALVDASRDAELVVVGSRGLGGFRGLLLGSVSRNVPHRAHCPVAVIRPFPHADSSPAD